jgi:hypothetical protein
MGFFKKIFKPFSKVLDKIVPNELKPALPYLAAFAPYLLGPGIMGSSMGMRALSNSALNAIGQLSQEGNEGELNPLSLLLAAGQGAGTAEGAGKTLRGFKTKPEAIPGGNMPGQGIGGFQGSELTGLQKAKNFSLEGLANLSDKLGGARDTLGGVLDMDPTQANLEIISKAGATPFSQATGDLAYAQGVKQKKDYEREEAQRLVEEEMRQRGLDQSYIDSIIASMTAYGYTQAEIDEILAMQGYARGGRVGYAFGGGIMDRPEADFISMDEVVENVNQDQLMAGMGSAMKLFETPYGFDRDGFEEMIIQFKEHQDAGGDLGINNFAENFLGMVKKDTPNAPMKMAQGGMMSVLPKGMEMDYRGGGMIPMGSKEKADDVPARVSKNEFVMTADAVRAAGGGSVNKGAQRMYQLMNNLEARA